MTRKGRPRIDEELLRAWWPAGVEVECMAREFDVTTQDIISEARDLGLRRNGQKRVTLDEWRAKRREMIANLMMPVLQSARQTRGAWAASELVETDSGGKPTRWQMGLL